MKSKIILTALTAGLFITGCSSASEPVQEPAQLEIEVPAIEEPTIEPITIAEINNAQQAWGEGLVAISSAYNNDEEDEDHEAIAQSILDNLYGYGDGVVLFKPTLVNEVPFRFTESEAASYFIGGDIEEDTGFALYPWTNVEFSNNGEYILLGDTALWMGTVILTDDNGDETIVHKTMGYYKDDNGNLKINVHHSSVPFEG